VASTPVKVARDLNESFDEYYDKHKRSTSAAPLSPKRPKSPARPSESQTEQAASSDRRSPRGAFHVECLHSFRRSRSTKQIRAVRQRTKKVAVTPSAANNQSDIRNFLSTAGANPRSGELTTLRHSSSSKLRQDNAVSPGCAYSGGQLGVDLTSGSFISDRRSEDAFA